MVESLDHQLLHALNGWVGHWPALDAIIVMFQRNPLLKGAPFVMLLILAWFSDRGEMAERLRRRQMVVAGVCGMTIALAVTRLVANLSPHQVRPILDPSLNLTLPGGLTVDHGSTWSSFPSDHATVWFSLALTLWLVNRSWGWIALAYAAVLGVLRVYVAFHTPSDIVAGALVGIVVVLLLTRPAPRSLLHRLAAEMESRAPGLFHAGFFLIAYQLTTLFTETRWLARLMLDLVSGQGVAGFPAD